MFMCTRWQHAEICLDPRLVEAALVRMLQPVPLQSINPVSTLAKKREKINKACYLRLTGVVHRDE